MILSLPAPTSFLLLVSTLGPLLAASWVCCLGALVCLSEDWRRMVSLPAGRTPPERRLYLLLVKSVSLVTSGDVICLF